MAERLCVANGDVELAVRVDPSTGPVVLLAHGIGSTGRFLFEAFHGPLADAGWCLAAMDLRGHGGSTPLPDPRAHHLDLQAGDVAAVAAAVGATVVGGVSLGGHAAVRAVAQGLVPGARAAASVLPAWTGQAVVGEGPHAAVADEIRGHGVVGMLGRLRGATDLPSWLRDLLVRDYAVHEAASLEAALLALDGGLAPTLTDVAALGVPLALVSWPDDPGHPDAVSRAWAMAAASGRVRVAHQTTSLAAVGQDRAEFGRALVAALSDLDLAPDPA